ncbi:MAG: radical SAM protein [Pseudomonadota bacterium]
MGINRAAYVEKIQNEYSDTYTLMKWLSDDQALRAEEHRRILLDRMGSLLNWSFSGTKPHTGPLSPGCRLCGQGTWSCLFINNICNARCFYCPSSQDEVGVPGTNALDFKNPEDYADYIRTFDIRGVSFSGGEPMMTSDLVLKYLKILRKRVHSPLHVWMYTNGILITQDKLKILRDAGLDEIRFDISANRYLLEKAALAVGVIPTVTVEIPAIPEDMQRLKSTAAELDSMGVNHLNLHQIRCTAYNRNNLIERGYTFLHGPKVTVLETELAALELMACALEKKISLPVNYCSFSYRHQYQSAGTRRRNALKIRAGWEDITQNGHIRTLAVTGDAATLSSIDRSLAEAGVDRSLWQCPKPGTRLMFHPSLLKMIPLEGVRLGVSYYATALKPGVSYRHPFTEIHLNNKKRVYVEKKAELKDTVLEGETIQAFAARYVPEAGTTPDPYIPSLSGTMEAIQPYETFQSGLAQYY